MVGRKKGTPKTGGRVKGTKKQKNIYAKTVDRGFFNPETARYGKGMG